MSTESAATSEYGHNEWPIRATMSQGKIAVEVPGGYPETVARLISNELTAVVEEADPNACEVGATIGTVSYDASEERVESRVQAAFRLPPCEECSGAVVATHADSAAYYCLDCGHGWSA